MSNVICIAAARAARLKQALSSYASNGDQVVIETRTGSVTAMKITCRGGFAEVLDSFGDYFVIDYADIRALRPGMLAQTSVVNARGDFRPIYDTAMTATRTVAILPFARRARRR